MRWPSGEIFISAYAGRRNRSATGIGWASAGSAAASMKASRKRMGTPCGNGDLRLADVRLRREGVQVDARRGFPAAGTVLGDDGREDAAAHVPAGGEPHEARLRGGHQVVQDAVGDGLVEGALVAVRPDVELEALQLDAGLLRDVVEGEDREVRLAGLGAQAGEFRDRHVDQEIAARLRVGEGLEILAGLGHWRRGPFR